jgi:hypothetical protein
LTARNDVSTRTFRLARQRLTPEDLDAIARNMAARREVAYPN